MVNAGKLLPQYLTAVVVCIGAASIGTVLAWSSPTQEAIMNGKYGFSVNEDQFSWVGSLPPLGAALMCLPTGPIITWLGPKWTTLVLIVPNCVGYALLIFATNIYMMCIARFVIGMVAGAWCVTSPMYIAEIAHKEIRGTLGSYFQLMLTVGILFVYIVGIFVSPKVLSIICGIMPIIFGILLFFFPESPTHLIKKGKTEEAAKALQFLRGKDYNINEELSETQTVEANIKESKMSFVDALKRKSTVRGLMISLGLMFFQQAGGVNAVIFYGADIFKDAQTGIDQNAAQLVVGIMQVLATFVSSLLIDKLGRRLLLICSGVVMAVSAVCLGIYFYLKEETTVSTASISWLPVLALCAFITLFSIGFGPVPWLMMGELFGSDVRGTASSMTATINWTLAFAVTKLFSTMKNNIGSYGAFWVFAGISFLSVIFIFFIVPETKGKSLEEIQRTLEGSGARDEKTEGKIRTQA